MSRMIEESAGSLCSFLEIFMPVECFPFGSSPIVQMLQKAIVVKVKLQHKISLSCNTAILISVYITQW